MYKNNSKKRFTQIVKILNPNTAVWTFKLRQFLNYIKLQAKQTNEKETLVPKPKFTHAQITIILENSYSML